MAYKSWEVENGCNLDCDLEDGIPSHVAFAYRKALDMLSGVRADLEDKISRWDLPNTERLQYFMDYLKFEEFCGYPSRVQSLYERALTEFPISSDLWLDYTNYLTKTLKTDRNLRHIYNKATRNSPWVGQLWVQYLLYLEQCHASDKEISDVFEKSLLCTFSTFDEYVDIFLTRVDGLRRRIAKELGEALDYTLIRDTFQLASDYLSPYLKNTYTLLQIHSYWARLELNLGKDLNAAREVWESLLKNSGFMVEAWKGYIVMEIQMGNINEARCLYKKCYGKRFSGTGSEEICNSWIQFEREYGTLEDFDHALQKVTSRLQQLQQLRLQEESKSIASSSSSGQKENSVKKNVHDKRKPTFDVYKPAKRQKDENDKAEVKTSVELEYNRGNTKSQKVTPDCGDDLRKKEKFTVFISNIKTKATYEDLRNFFNDIGGVVAVRILNDRVTKESRGLAFVDFSDEAHLEAAVAKDKQKLIGKRLSIARSDPTAEKNRGKGKSISTEHGVGEHTQSIRGPQTQTQRHDDNVQLKGKNTFMPRAVSSSGSTSTQGEDFFPKFEDKDGDK